MSDNQLVKEVEKRGLIIDNLVSSHKKEMIAVTKKYNQAFEANRILVTENAELKAIGLKLLNAYWSKLAEKMPFPEDTDLIKEARQALNENKE